MTDRLRVAFAKHEDWPFPDDSSDDSASQLHAELADYDGYVAGRVSTLINGGRLGKGDLKLDMSLKNRLEDLSNSDSIGSADARAYLEYFHQLEVLLALAKDFAK